MKIYIALIMVTFFISLVVTNHAAHFAASHDKLYNHVLHSTLYTLFLSLPSIVPISILLWYSPYLTYCSLFYSTLLYSTLLYSTLLCSALLYSALLKSKSVTHLVSDNVT